MPLRREQRVALAAFRHHSHLAVYEGADGRTCKLRFIDQHMVELDGEYGESVFQEDMIQVLTSELPTHRASSGDKLKSLDDGQVYILGREIKDDGYIRTIEVAKQ